MEEERERKEKEIGSEISTEVSGSVRSRREERDARERATTAVENSREGSSFLPRKIYRLLMRRFRKIQQVPKKKGEACYYILEEVKELSSPSSGG